MYPVYPHNGYHYFPSPSGFAAGPPGTHVPQSPPVVMNPQYPPFLPGLQYPHGAQIRHGARVQNLAPNHQGSGSHQGYFNPPPPPHHQDHQNEANENRPPRVGHRPHNHPYRRNPDRRLRNRRRCALEQQRDGDEDSLGMDYVIDDHELNFDERDSDVDDVNGQRVDEDAESQNGNDDENRNGGGDDQEEGNGNEEEGQRNEEGQEEGLGGEQGDGEGQDNEEERQGNGNVIGQHGHDGEEDENEEAIQHVGQQQRNAFDGRPDRTWYSLEPPAALTSEHINFLVERADQLAVQPRPTVRNQPTDVFISLMPTHMSPQLAIEWISHVYRISPQHWHHHSTRPCLIRGVPDTVEHVFKVHVSARNDVPLGRKCWKSVFTPTVLRAGRGIIFHALSESELVRLVVLGAYMEVFPNVGTTLSDDHRRVVGDITTIRRVWRDPGVRLRVRSVSCLSS